MAYIRPGLGSVLSIPLSDWGLVGSPCTMGAAAVVTPDPRCGGASSGGACVTSSFPFVGTSDVAGNCQPVSQGMGLGILAAIGVVLYATFRRGR